MEEYVEIPAEMDAKDIEIRTCDEMPSAGMEDTDGKHFYIVQQTSDGLVIQIAEPNDAGGGETALGLAKQVEGTTVVHLNQSDASQMVTSTLMNASDIAGLVASGVITQTPETCDVDTGNVDVSQCVSGDEAVGVAVSGIDTGDVEASELVDSNVGDAEANVQGEGHCDATEDVHSTDFDGDDVADHAPDTREKVADHAYISDANSLTEATPDVTENIQDDAKVSSDTLVPSSNSETAASEAVVDPSDLSSNEDATKAALSRRTSLRTRKRQVTNETEPSNEEAKPKTRPYQRRQRTLSNKDIDKPGADNAAQTSASSKDDAPAEKNGTSKRAGKRRTSFTALVANRKVSYAQKENEETSSDLSVPVVPRAGPGVHKSVVLTDMAYINKLKAEVDELQKLNGELKSRMKQMERKNLMHQTDRKTLTGGSDRKVLGSDRKIGINWKDMKFSVRKSTSPRTTSPKDVAENKAYLRKIDGLASQGRELSHREEMVEKKEQRLKALDMELDRRSSIIKCKEAKLERLESQLKVRENALQTREKRLSNREGRGEDMSERVNGQPSKESKLNEREKQLQAKEKDLEMKQELLRATERQLTALGQELTDKFHYLKTKQGGRNVPVAMATSIGASQKRRQVAGKVTKVAARRMNHLKTVGNTLAANKKNANKEKVCIIIILTICGPCSKLKPKLVMFISSYEPRYNWIFYWFQSYNDLKLD